MKTKHILFAFLFSLPILLIIYLTALHRSPIDSIPLSQNIFLTALQRSPIDSIALAQKHAWTKQHFIAVKPFERISIEINKLTMPKSVQLSADQEIKLRVAITQMLKAYCSGDFKAYSDFRRCTSYAFDFARIRLILTNYPRLFHFPPIPEEPEARLQELWRDCNTMTITEISPESINLSVQQINKMSQVRLMLTHLTDFGISFYHGNLTSYTEISPIVYNNTPENVFNSQGVLYYAKIALAVKVNKKADLHPVYAGFYWSPSDNAWLPFALAAGFPQPVNQIEYSLFF